MKQETIIQSTKMNRTRLTSNWR